jgi:DNA-binding Lrp family transcriptional regulator
MNENKIELSGIFSQGYGIIPKALMKHPALSKNAKLILAYMLSYTGAGNTCFPSQALIAEDLGISKPVIIKAIQEAVNKGFIKKTKLYPDKPLKHNNKYELVFLTTEVKNINLHDKDSIPPKLKNNTRINNTINNNNPNKDNSGSPPPLKGKLKKVDEPERIPGLHMKIKNAFFENNSKEMNKLVNWKKETPHVMSLEKRAQVMPDPELNICEIIAFFYMLINSRDQKKDSIYIGQPFLPSILNSNRMWNQVINRMAQAKEQGLSKSDKEILEVIY